MKRAATLASLAVALLATGAVLAAAAKEEAKPQEVPILQQWQGLFPIKQVNVLPEGQRGTPTGFIADPKVFEAVWKAWKGGEKTPAVDFQKNLVVFSRNVQYLNVIHIGPVLIKDGVVEVLGIETMSAIPIEDKCHMAAAVISREGVKAVMAGAATVTVPPPEAAKEPAKESPKTAA